MLTVYAIGADSERYSLSAAQSLVLCKDVSTPADSLCAVFPQEVCEELAEIYVYDGDEIVFSGVVDEQIIYAGDKVRTEIIARNKAALLLDNEAEPAVYINPSAELIFRRYLRPLGIDNYAGENKAYPGEFKVQKGISCWKVAENFCVGTYGTVPYVRDGTVFFQGEKSNGGLFFSCDSKDGIVFTSFQRNIRRCKLLSRVRVKTRVGDSYSVEVENPDALGRGIHRERYLNASEYSAQSLAVADEMIASSVNSSEESEVCCPLRLTDVLRSEARVEYSEGEYLSGLCVSSLRYSLSSAGESTKLVLKRKEK